MQQLDLSASQIASIDSDVMQDNEDDPQPIDANVMQDISLDEAAEDAPAETTLLAMQLTAAKRLAASAFERRYLIHVMKRAGGSVSEGARLSGLDRTNFRRMLQRHGLRPAVSRNVVAL